MLRIDIPGVTELSSAAQRDIRGGSVPLEDVLLDYDCYLPRFRPMFPGWREPFPVCPIDDAG